MKALGLFALIPVGMFLNALALSVLWGWFVVPLGVVSIGKAHAFGLAVLVNLFTQSHKRETKDEQTSVLVFSVLFAPIVALGAGWMFHQFM